MEKRTGSNVTPERRQIVKSAQVKRRQRLKEAAQKVGFDTIDKLADAIPRFNEAAKRVGYRNIAKLAEAILSDNVIVTKKTKEG